MDFSTLVANAAQAAPSPVSKPGTGHAAGAPASPAAGAAGAANGAGFASLVALALGQLDGGGEAGAASAPTGSGPVEGEASETDTAVDERDASTADAATLSVLIALSTPMQASVAPQPEIVAVETVAVAAAIGGTSVEAAAVASGDLGEVAAPAGAPVADAAFEDLLATASEDSAIVGEAAAVAAATVQGAATPAASEMLEAAAVPAATPATTAAEAPTTASAAGGYAPRGPAKPSTQPVRELLVEAAAATAAGDAPVAQPEHATTPAVTPAIADESATATGATAREPRRAAAAQAEAPAAASTTVPAFQAQAGLAGDSGTGSARDGSAGMPFASDSRVDATPTAAFAGTSAAFTPEALASGALVAMPGLATGADGALRAIEFPGAARFEQTLSTLDPDVRNLEAMVRTVRLFAAGNGATEARLTLEPEHLGPVALTVRVEQGSVSAHFRAETPAAHRWIETHQQDLRSGLREQGLEVKEVVVTTDPDGRRERRQEPQARRPTSRRQQADAPRFEVLV